VVASTGRSSSTLRFGWRTLTAYPDRILVPALVITVPAVVAHLVLQSGLGLWFAASRDCSRTYLGTSLIAQCGPSTARTEFGLVVGLFGLLALVHLVFAGFSRVISNVLDSAVTGSDQPPPFSNWNWATTLPTSLILAAALSLGAAFLILPALVIGFLTRYALAFALDGFTPWAAIRASVRLVNGDLGSELWFCVRAVGVLLLGTVLLGVGLYAAVPVVLIAQTGRYRAARGQL
jgi:uncharacterized membrane protein